MRKLSHERIISSHVKKPDYYYQFRFPGSTVGVPEIKDALQIKATRLSCRMAGQVLEACSTLIKVSCDFHIIFVFVSFPSVCLYTSNF